MQGMTVRVINSFSEEQDNLKQTQLDQGLPDTVPTTEGICSVLMVQWEPSLESFMLLCVAMVDYCTSDEVTKGQLVTYSHTEVGLIVQTPEQQELMLKRQEEEVKRNQRASTLATPLLAPNRAQRRK